MATVIENEPGFNFSDDEWDQFERHADLLTLKAGTSIVPQRRDQPEIFLVLKGTVACDTPKRDGISRRLLFDRGTKFSPTDHDGAARYSTLTDVTVHRLFVYRLDRDWRLRILARVGFLEQIDTFILDAMKAMTELALFERVPAETMLQMLRVEGVVLEAPRAGIVAQGDAEGFYFIASGSVEIEQQPPPGPVPFWKCDILNEGKVYGGSGTIKPISESCILLWLPKKGIDRCLYQWFQLRRSLRDARERCTIRADGPDLPQFVLLYDHEVGAAAEILTELVAQVVALDQQAKTLLLEVQPRPPTPTPFTLLPSPRHYPALLDRGTVGLPDFRPAELVTYRTVFIVIKGGDVHEAGFPFEGLFRPQNQRLPVTVGLISPAHGADHPEVLDAFPFLVIVPILLVGGPHADGDDAHPRKGVRLRINPQELIHIGVPDIARPPRTLRDALARLARALTGRLVGVALGGGAAWGYAHLALLEALNVANIPIDMVSGVSAGSLVASYYCALGLPGLQRLREIGRRLDLVLLASMISSKPLAWSVSLDVDGRRLRDLDVPFFAVAADLSNGGELNPTLGSLSVGECVRAASALVPLVAPTNFTGRRVADGMYINNTGERVLAQQGANFIISSDVIQTPDKTAPTDLFNLLYRLRRVRDPIDAGYLLVRTSDRLDAQFSDAAFEPVGLPNPPVGMFRGPSIEKVARPQADVFVQQEVVPRWAALNQ